MIHNENFDLNGIDYPSTKGIGLLITLGIFGGTNVLQSKVECVHHTRRLNNIRKFGFNHLPHGLAIVCIIGNDMYYILTFNLFNNLNQQINNKSSIFSFLWTIQNLNKYRLPIRNSNEVDKGSSWELLHVTHNAYTFFIPHGARNSQQSINIWLLLC